MSSLRRRSSSQYTLFPTCTPLKSPNVGIVEAVTHIAPNRCASPALAISGRKAASKRSGKEKNRRHSTNGFSTIDSKSPSTNNSIVRRAVEQLKRSTSTNMNRLIPLKLEVCVKSRMSLPPTGALPTTIMESPSTSPIYPPPERPSIPSRISSKKTRRAAPVTDLIIIPYTQEEWRNVMDEVRTLYRTGKYKQCSARAVQILDGIKDPYRVNPLYAIFLSFVAANSLEMTANSIHNHSSTKLPLYQEALLLYQKAESYFEYASFSADPNIIQPRQTASLTHHASHSSMSSTTSVRSSVDSIFSHRSSSACSMASSVASPASFDSELSRLGIGSSHRRSSSLSSRSSNESFRGQGSTRRPKKKVSFSTQLTILLSETDGALPNPNLEQECLLDSFPTPPTRITTTIITIPETSSPIQTPSPTSTPDSSYYLNLSLANYRRHLADLQVQLSYHITSVHASIASVSCARKPRRSNGADLTAHFLDEDNFGGLVERDSIETRKKDLAERISSMKATGWQRKRFDGERYQILAEKALEEVAGNIR